MTFSPLIWVGGQRECDPIKIFLMIKLACLHDKREMNSIAMSGTQNNIYSIVDKIALVKNMCIDLYLLVF